jgi:hypothetical protein
MNGSAPDPDLREPASRSAPSVLTQRRAPDDCSDPSALASTVERRCRSCGGDLPAPASTGRPRRYCCTSCRRRGDHLERRVARRRALIAEWQAVRDAWRAGDRTYRRAEIRRQLRELKAELFVLECRRHA